MSDNQRYGLMIMLMSATLILIAIVNLVASIQTRNNVRTVTVCAADPHGNRCQQQSLPKVFSEATTEELLRYKQAIKLRQEALRKGGNTP